MTAVDGQLVLTDDEVVALAIAARRPWPTAVPSLEPDARMLAAAAFRGSRSLAVRGDGVDARLLDSCIRPLLDAATRLTVGRDRPARDGGGDRTVFHPVPEGVVRESISIDGLHVFRRTTSAESAEEILGVLTTSDGDDVWLSVPTDTDELVVARARDLAASSDVESRRRSLLLDVPVLAEWLG